MPTEDELDAMSGFNRPQIVFFPSIKFGSTKQGQTPIKEFSLLSTNDKGELVVKSLGEKLEVALLHRGKMKLKTSDLYSSEYEKGDEMVAIFSKEKGFKKDSGTAKEMKEKYQMRTVQSPYVLLPDETSTIAKLTVIPSSLSNYWDYLNEFKGKERPRMFKTIIEADKKESKGKGGAYFKIVFSKGVAYGTEEYEFIQTELVELNDKMKNNDKARATITQDKPVDLDEETKLDYSVLDDDLSEEEKQEKDSAGLGS